MPEFFVGAFCCLVLAAGGAWYSWSSWAKVRQVLATPTSPIRDLLDAGKRQRAKPGGQGRQVEIKGFIRSQEVLTAEMSHRPCVWFQAIAKMRVRKVEGHGKNRRVRTSIETLTDHKEFQRFWVEDPTGRIMVMPEGAEIEGFPSVRREEPVAGSLLEVSSIWSFLGLEDPPDSILANIYEENILPIDQAVYVLGELSGGTGEPFIRRAIQAKDGDHAFMISVKPEEEIIKGMRFQMLLGFGLSLLALAATAGCLFYGIRGL